MSDDCIKTQGNMVDWLKKVVFIPVILVSVGSANAVTSVTGCGTLSTAGETYVLQNDISASGTCITIGADNITLDGAGYSITGDGSGDGVDLRWRSGVTVKNLNVSGFWSGIELYSSSYNTISNNTASNNRNGIYLDYSSNNTLSDNTASNNWIGIYLWFSSNNTITGNTANLNGASGIYLQSSSGNTLSGNTMSLNTYNFWILSSEVSDFVQTIDTSNTVDGKPIYYLVGASDQVIDSSTGAGYVAVVNSVNVTVKDLTLTKNGVGVLFANTSNSFILNVTASNNHRGIFLRDSSSNTITNNTASNKYNGIRLRSSSNNTIAGNTASNNQNGIYLTSSSNNTITDNTASNNWIGIYLYDSSSNTLKDNAANLNNGDGIYLDDSSDRNTLINNTANSNNNNGGIRISSSSSNTITDNTANSNNYYGIYLVSSSNNTLRDNTASSNNNYGIYLSSSSNNNIFNNFFNNTDNYRFYGTVYANTWNTTKTPGPNIIGGPYLGGNFWAKPDGTGFSETCTDADRDGICDSSYSLASGNVDYLPLTILPVDVTTTVIQRLDYKFNITWTIPPDPDLKEFNIYQRLNDNSSTDTLIDTVPANYTQPYIAGPGYDDGNLYQYMVTPVNTSGSEGSGAYAPKGGPAPPIPFAPLGTLLTLGSGLAAYLWYRRKVI